MLPNVINPMLAQKSKAPFDSEQHLFEIKWDGIRCLAFCAGGRVRLQSRHLTEVTAQFPELAELSRLPSGTVLDGEIVVLQRGKPSFRHVQERALLQNRQRIRQLSDLTPVTYMVFDLPYLSGKPFLAVPFALRREALQALIARAALPGVLVPEGICGHGCQMFDRVAELGLEGIIAKRLDSPYLPGRRSRHWLKIKPNRVAEKNDASFAKYTL
jgi:ATP-dependent DNA ligase